MQDNEVFVNKYNLIEIHVIGDQTRMSVLAMGDEVKRLAAKLRASHKPVLVIDVLYQIGQVSPDARRQVVAIAKEVDFVKAVMVGSGPVLRLGANLMLRAVGKASTIRYFEDYDAAVEWLLKP